MTYLSNYFPKSIIRFYETLEVSMKSSILWSIVILYVIIYESPTSVNYSIYVLYTLKIDLLMIWKSKPEQEYLRNHLSLRPLHICNTNGRTAPNCRYKGWTCSIKTEGDIRETRCLIFFGTPYSLLPKESKVNIQSWSGLRVCALFLLFLLVCSVMVIPSHLK